MEQQQQQALRIDRCNDASMWYSRLIGYHVPLVRIDDECYWSREPAGYLNVVSKSDATVVTAVDPAELNKYLVSFNDIKDKIC